MADWVISPRSGIAFLDLREGDVTMDAVDPLLDALVPYLDRGQIKEIVVAVKPARSVADQVLLNSVRRLALSRDILFEVQQ